MEGLLTSDLKLFPTTSQWETVQVSFKSECHFHTRCGSHPSTQLASQRTWVTAGLGSISELGPRALYVEP